MNEDELTKIELKKYFETNKNFLSLDTPFENWDSSVILFSSNEKVKGKIYFKLDRVDFKLAYIVWMPYSLKGSRSYESKHWFEKPLERIKNGEFIFPSDENGKCIYEQIPSLCLNIKEVNQKYLLELELKRVEQERIDEELRLAKLSNNKSQILLDLDKNNDGVIDVIEWNDFNKLLQKNQKLIIEIDRGYIQKFVKISNYIKTKRNNIQLIFESISLTKNEEELNEQVHLIRNQIHTYELLIFHSINLIGAIVAEEMITFYEIYESFDKLGMFNSNWESEVSEKLSNIDEKLDDIMYSIYQMENNIVNEISNLTYTTQSSFRELGESVSRQLIEIDSSLQVNNLLTGIQAYQMYKINKNTKSLRN